MNFPKLIEPVAGLEDEHSAMLGEWRRAGETPVPWVLGWDSGDFPAYVERLRACERGAGLAGSAVPHSTRWLVDASERILGVANIRHRLNGKLLDIGGHIGFGIRPSERRKGLATLILELALRETGNLGVAEALVTCDKDNAASAKTITNNRGVLFQEKVVDGKAVLGFRIGAAPRTVLETERLRLREMAESDLDFLASMLGDAEVMRFYPKPLSRDEACDWFYRVRACYARAGHGFWLVERRGSGEKVGQIGLLPKEIDGRSEVEAAYMVHRPFWRQGIAAEAAMACRDYALDVIKVPRVVSLIRPENQPSLEVGRRLGMKRIGEIMHAGFPHGLFEYRRPGARLPG